jgi:hypothetical protein
MKISYLSVLLPLIGTAAAGLINIREAHGVDKPALSKSAAKDGDAIFFYADESEAKKSEYPKGNDDAIFFYADEAKYKVCIYQRIYIYR